MGKNAKQIQQKIANEATKKNFSSKNLIKDKTHSAFFFIFFLFNKCILLKLLFNRNITNTTISIINNAE